MIRELSERIRSCSSTAVVVIASAVFIVFSALVLPSQAATAESYTAGAGSPDTSLLYSADDLYRMADAYGDYGRRLYVHSRFTFDLIWPLVYAIFLATAISWAYGGTFSSRSPWQLANLAPVLGAAFDYLENASTSLVMLRYPHPAPVVATFAPGFTFIKWIFVGGSFALLIVGVAAGLWRWIRRSLS